MLAFKPDNKPLGTVITSSWVPRLIDFAERITVVVTFAIYVYLNYDPAHWLNFAIAFTDIITVWFVLIRRPADSVSPDPEDWILALGGTLLAMMARPGGEPLIPGAVAFCIATQGTIITLAAKFSLARSFGLAPANRGVRMRGAYVFVRHPMYLGYAVTHTAYVLMNPTRTNFMLIGATWLCQLGRVLREERWLMQDRAYRRYSRIVRFRMIPGLF
ncbi:MAG: isoprenylcysteine carboxylmethyltransferase family protein [Proteobacteria bacterium]|nr:isoprenylcysteine carboxylmethyltransferase family protein [Pseudomonadota bacterium]